MSSTPASSVLYLRVPAALHRQLAKLAAQNRRKLTAEAQIALERHVTAEKEKAA